jgi:hypothetical protein
MRSQLAERVGKSPRELMSGERHPHGSPCWTSGRFRTSAPEPGRLTASTAQNSPANQVRPSTAGRFRALVCYPKFAKNEPRLIQYAEAQRQLISGRLFRNVRPGWQ